MRSSLTPPVAATRQLVDQALLFNTTGGVNTAYGDGTLVNNVTGSNNTAIGFDDAGFNATGRDNVLVGAGVEGFASDDGVCRIGSIYGATITNGTKDSLT